MDLFIIANTLPLRVVVPFDLPNGRPSAIDNYSNKLLINYSDFDFNLSMFFFNLIF